MTANATAPPAQTGDAISGSSTTSPNPSVAGPATSSEPLRHGTT